MKNLKLIATSLILSGFLLGCGGSEDKSSGGDAGAPKEKDKKIGVTIYRFDDNFMATMRQSLEKTSQELGGLELLMNDSQNDQSKQNDQVDVMLSKGVDALSINLVDPASAQTIIDKAAKEEVPVVFFNKEPSDEAMNSYDKVYYVGTDSKESGIIQGDIIAKYWKEHPEVDKNGDGKIQYVLLTGEPGHPDAEARSEYVIKTLNEEYNIETEEINEDTAMWDTAQAKDKMEAWLSGPNGDKIEVAISNNDGMALGVVEAIKGNNAEGIAVFGVDALDEALVKIRDGEMAGTVLNDAPNQAKATLELTKNVANGKDPLEGTNWKMDGKAVRVPYVGIDSENFEDFMSK